MAITPTEAQRRATPDERTLKDLERRIDEHIVRSLRSGSGITFDARSLSDSATRTAIMQRYRAAGWTVTYESDQRDGDYLSFSPGRKRAQYSDQRDCVMMNPSYGDR